MMISILELLFQDKISVEDLFLWLNGSSKSIELETFESLKYDFTPSFINFLRDQTSSFLNAANISGLTPGKLTHSLKTAKYKSPQKSTVKGKRSSKAALNFSNSSYCQNVSDTATESYNFNMQSLNLTSPQNKSESNTSDLLFFPLSPVHENNNRMMKFKSSLPFNSSCAVTPKQEFYPIVASTPTSTFKPNVKRRSFDENKKRKPSSQTKCLGDFIVDKKTVKKKPVSKNINFNKSKSKLDDREENFFDISDMESFPPVGSTTSSKNSVGKKRITPTLVSSSSRLEGNNPQNIKHAFEQSSPSVFLESTEVDSNFIFEERQFLQDELKKFNTREKNLYISDTPNKENRFQKKVPNPETFTALPDKATFIKELDVLCKVYVNLISFNMVPNIMIELYYLFQLLTLQTNRDIEPINEGDFYFTSVDNCVYFSVSSLSLLFSCLCHLDRATLKLLSENSRIKTFSFTLHSELERYCEILADVKQYAPPPSSPILSVSFQSETDNRSNFPTTVDFQVFRKQRDNFYEILRIWEDNHLNPTWSFKENLSKKINTILTMNSDSTNYMHFARLFYYQLMAMCKENGPMSHSADLEGLTFLTQLRKEQPQKYQKLYERLVTPSRFGGPVPMPSFPGSQEFFHDFIVTASNPIFQCHLRNLFITHILELNDIEYHLSEIEGEMNPDFTKEQIWSSLQSLRLLAKFLGLLEFLPYQTSTCIVENVVINQISLRNKISPPLAFLDILKESASSGSVTIAVIWIVEYFSMVDPVALHTRYYLTLAFVLIFLYKLLYVFKLNPKTPDCKNCPKSNKLWTFNSWNSFCLKFLLGWLFSLPNFPEGLFYAKEDEIDIDFKEYASICKVISNRYTSYCFPCLQSVKDFSFISDGDSPVKSSEVSSPDKIFVHTPLKDTGASYLSPIKTPKTLHISMIETPDVTPQKYNLPKNISQNSRDKVSSAIDVTALIDSKILSYCCPFIGELKNMLMEFSIGISRCSGANNIRKITPLTSSERTIEQTERNLQLQLEDNFFHNKPSATRKTVEFAIERKHSRVLKYLRSFIIPKLKEEILSELKPLISAKLSSYSDVDKVNEILERKMHEMIPDIIMESKMASLKKAEEETAKDELESALTYFLPDDVTKMSIEMCCKIVRRTVLERTTVWLNTHLTASFWIKELTTDTSKFIKQILKGVGTDNSHLNNSSFSQLQNSLIEGEGLLESSVEQEIDKDESKVIAEVPQISNDNDFEELTPSSILMQLKDEIRDLIKSDNESLLLTEEKLFLRIERVKIVVKKQKSLRLLFYKALATLFTDWIVTRCIRTPEIMTEKVIDKALQLWLPVQDGGIFSPNENLANFLSARTVMLLGQGAPDLQLLGWKRCEILLSKMLFKYDFLSANSFEYQCISLLQQHWPKIIHHALSNMIKNISSELERHSKFKFNPDIAQMLDWVSWVCDEMD